MKQPVSGDTFAF